ncbi:MAG: serine hydrolase [Chitinophagaceae bacterium]|nr:serine hydrolase [Chitinophagaceae bacterium]
MTLNKTAAKWRNMEQIQVFYNKTIMKKIILLLLFPVLLNAQKNYPALLDEYMKAAVNVNQFSGSVLIANHDSIIYQKTFGTIDYAGTKALDNNSTFQLGIITEEFTASAILLLKDNHKLKLTDTITKFFPELPYNNVTIQHLLTHSSGLPDYYDEVMKGKWGTEKYATNKDIVKALAEAKVALAWKPGTQYNEFYYYTDYALLAAIIEKVSGLSYADFMQVNIFTPLHMLRTSVKEGFDKPESKDANTTESIYFDEAKQQFFPAANFSAFGSEYDHVAKNIVGSKGVSSTAQDLFLWNKALQHHTLISLASQQEMFTPGILKDSISTIFMGYGVLVGTNDCGSYVAQIDAGNNETLGYITTLIHYLEDDLTIILLANKAKSSSSIAGTLSYILFDKEIVPPYIHKAVTIDTSILEKYVGEYTQYHKRLYKKEGTLWMTIRGEPDLKLLPESNTKFFSSDKEYDWQVEFNTDNNGNIIKTYFIYSGLKQEVKKIK